MTATTNTDRLKQLCFNLRIYKPLRKVYDQINQTRPRMIRESMEALSGFVHPGDLCFDVGANVGRKAESMLRLGARVVAVEPQPGCIRDAGGTLRKSPPVHPRAE